jgi:hypothetical protein
MKPIVNIAREYAERTFTREFLETTTDSWYFDALDWFENKYNVTPESKEAYKFSGEIQAQFDRYYTKEFGKRDDYYHLKGIMSDMKEMHDKLEEMLKHGTVQPHGATLKDCMKHLTEMQFSLGLVRSSMNRKYNFEKDK